MKHKIFCAIALFLIGIAISGCNLMDLLPIPNMSPLPTTASINNVRISIQVEADLFRDFPEGSSHVPEQRINAVFQSSGTVSYNSATHIFTSTWDGGSFSDTSMYVEFSATRDRIVSFEAHQTKATFAGWNEWHMAKGTGIQLAGSDDHYDYYEVLGVETCSVLSEIAYREFSNVVEAAYNSTTTYCNETSYLEIRVNRL